jgi:hypothetical protein
METKDINSSKLFTLSNYQNYHQLKYLSSNRIETSDGAKREETGDFRYVGGLVVRGSYEFIGDDGITYQVDYVADEKGFRPSAPHLPK